MVEKFVLSLFPGIDVLGLGFEQEGFIVVRGPDPLWGSLHDVRRFHPRWAALSTLQHIGETGTFPVRSGGPGVRAIPRLPTWPHPVASQARAEQGHGAGGIAFAGPS